jgi:hypothetical protein
MVYSYGVYRGFCTILRGFGVCLFGLGQPVTWRLCQYLDGSAFLPLHLSEALHLGCMSKQVVCHT